MKKRGGLGRGLDTIFAENSGEGQEGAVSVKIGDIEPNRDQPRKEFDPAALSELADSIAQHGVLQPLLLRPMLTGGYRIVAGERRWRAARMAGLTEVPAVIRDMSDADEMLFALIENLQREDLSPLEEARGYRTLIESQGLTQEEAAKAVGKSRPAVTNALRLLNLPEDIQEMLERGGDHRGPRQDAAELSHPGGHGPGSGKGQGRGLCPGAGSAGQAPGGAGDGGPQKGRPPRAALLPGGPAGHGRGLKPEGEGLWQQEEGRAAD